MKNPHRKPSWPAVWVALAGLVSPSLTSCTHQEARNGDAEAGESSSPAAVPLEIALAPHAGEGHLDELIRRCQGAVRSNQNARASLERLGWLYVGKARESFDAGFYTLAEQCALALDTSRPGCAEALLLRGHALHSLHRFSEAARLARRLVEMRGLAADHGLLGDVLVDVGRLDEAEHAYQAMLDLKPDPQGYARAAHLRWVKGDLEGAVEVMRMAAGGTSPRDVESAAWMHTQLGRYLWHSGANLEAQQALESALALRTDYPPALLLRGRMWLADDRPAAAVEPLERAARLNPLPEYQWALAEALRAARRESDARAVGRLIVSAGPRNDPRTCSLFLATHAEQPELAIRLARQELAERSDVFSHDALAWALAAAGRFAEAEAHMQQALAAGTCDARLWLHAGVIAAQSGRHAEAAQWLRKVDGRRAQLLPSERVHWQRARQAIRFAAEAIPASPAPAPTQPISAAALTGPVPKT